MTFDSRYYRHDVFNDYDSTFQLQEWKVMNESRVDEMLTSLHNFAYFHNGSIKKRDDVYMSFSTRNTIPWSLSCEIMDGKDRNFGL